MGICERHHATQTVVDSGQPQGSGGEVRLAVGRDGRRHDQSLQF
jgi:hypothetical protein